MTVDQERLEQLMGRVIDEPGAALGAVREWLRAMAAGGYVGYAPESGTYAISEEVAFAMADPDGPTVPGACQVVLGALEATGRVAERFTSGEGLGWHEHHHDLFEGPGASSGPSTPRTSCGHVRLPARHGRPEGSRTTHARRAGGGRRLDDRRAHGRVTASRTTSTQSDGSSTPPARSSALLPRSRRTARAALGAHAGEAALTEVIRSGRFSRVRRAGETPVNIVLEARP